MAETRADQPRPEYEETAAERDLVRTLRGGTSALRKAAAVYLPQNPAETVGNYQIRVRQSTLTPFYPKLADAFVSRLLQEAPTVTGNRLIDDVLADFDSEGTPFSAWVRDFLTYGVDQGIVYALVDAPNSPVETVADQRRNRPFVRIITANDLLSWKYENGDDGMRHMTRAHVAETSTEVAEDDEFGLVYVKRTRVLEVVEGGLRTRIYREARNGQLELESDDTIDYDRPGLPIVALSLRELAQGAGVPLFVDVAYANMQHAALSSDYGSLLRYAMVPILTLASNQAPEEGKEVTIGAGNLTVLPGENAKLAYVELEGKSLSSGRQAIIDIEESMQQMASRILLGALPHGTVTATSHAISRSESDSDIRNIADLLREALQQIFFLLAYWLGVDEPEVDVFDQFSAAPSAEFAKLLLDMASQNLISRDTLWHYLRQHGILPADFDPEREEFLLQGTIDRDFLPAETVDDGDEL